MTALAELDLGIGPATVIGHALFFIEPDAFIIHEFNANRLVNRIVHGVTLLIIATVQPRRQCTRPNALLIATQNTKQLFNLIISRILEQINQRIG